MNKLIINGHAHDLTEAYRRGALACRNGEPYEGKADNPFQNGPAFLEYAIGYGFEQKGLNVRSGIDVIMAPHD